MKIALLVICVAGALAACLWIRAKAKGRQGTNGEGNGATDAPSGSDGGLIVIIDPSHSSSGDEPLGVIDDEPDTVIDGLIPPPPSTLPPPPVKPCDFTLEAAATTNVGGRDNNEDIYLIGEDLFLVADGMGGQQAGEEASRLLKESFQSPAHMQGPLWFMQSVWAAHDAMKVAVAQDSQLEGLGTTVTAARPVGNQMHVLWSGDTDFFRLRGGKFERLTFEHSLARALLDAGMIDASELKQHKMRNMLHKFVGAGDAPSWDAVTPFDMEDGDVYLISSDGLSDYCEEAQIAEVLGRNLSSQEKADALIQLALSCNTRDNVTALVIHVRKKA